MNTDNQGVKKLLQATNRPATADRLRRYLLFLMVILPSLTIFTLLFFSNLNNKGTLEEEARSQLKNTTTESARQAQAFIQKAEDQLVLSMDLVKSNVVQVGVQQSLENYFISQLEINSSIASMYAGAMNGDFIYVSRAQESDKGKYRVKTIQHSNGNRQTKIWWRNSGSENIDEQIVPDDGYDPRERPWYQEATNAMGLIWTDPYVFFTAQRLGVTTAMPLLDNSGAAIAAIGVDMELTELAEFLSSLEVNNFGSSFITAQDGQLIASASMLERYKNKSGELALEILSEPNVGYQNAFRAYQAVQENAQNASFQHDDQNYLVESLPMSLSEDSKWWIVTFAPENEFLSAIRNTEKNDYVIAGLITAISMLLGLFLARFTWIPIANMEQKANIDQLTQLHNRHFLKLNAKKLIKKAKERDEVLSVAIIDIDHFKPINDTYGHHVGDQVLQAFAKRLSNQSRPLDILARFGGEEFVLVMPNTGALLAQSIVNNERISMSDRPYVFDDNELKVTFSAGVASLNEDLDNINMLLKAADWALYQSKQNGRDQVSIFNPLDISELTVVTTKDFVI